MATKKKMLEAAAGNAGGEALNVEDVFSTYLYTGTGSATTITNGIDLAGEGGMVWGKSRTSGVFNHQIMDTERGTRKVLVSNTTDAEASNGDISAFNSDGFSLSTGNNLMLSNGQDFASWTFRKAPKFFDVVTWTGDGVAGRTVSHNLGSTPGCVIIKRTDGTQYWEVYHRGTTAGKKLVLNSTGAEANGSDITAVSDTTITLSSSYTVNGATSANYVAYLFAHNDGDGDFGPTGDQDIIKCGSYTGNASTNAVNLGFEPQIVIIKPYSHTGNWEMYDTMRGFARYGDRPLYPNKTNAETEYPGDYLAPTATGFELNQNWSANTNGYSYIYIAIRRGPMAVPESATDVFAMDASASSTDPSWSSNFPVDFNFYRDPSGGDNWYTSSRLTGNKFMYTNSTGAELSDAIFTWDYMDGWGNRGANTGEQSWMWKRAPNYFDVVAYTGDGTSNRNVSHNLGVAPEMIWVKARNAVKNWMVFLNDSGDYLRLNLTDALASTGSIPTWTDGSFSLAGGTSMNGSGTDYIAYLFASLDGVSKVGSYTGNGTSQTIDCGFSAGARFVLIKPTSATGHWVVFDTERGIVAGGDPYLLLNGTNAETTGFDELDPDNSGFIVNNSAGVANVNGVSYIFYAIA